MLGQEGDDGANAGATGDENEDTIVGNDEVDVYIEDCKVHQCHVRLPL